MPKMKGRLFEMLASVMYPATTAHYGKYYPTTGIVPLTVTYERGSSKGLKRQGSPFLNNMVLISIAMTSMRYIPTYLHPRVLLNGH